MAKERSPNTPITETDCAALLAAILDCTEDAVFSRSPEGTITSWNRGAQAIFGYSAEEALGRHVSLLVPEGQRREIEGIDRRILRGERVEHLETLRLTKECREIHVSLTFAPIHGSDGVITGIAVIGRDITDKVRMERSLKESEARYRTLVEMAPDAVVVHQDGRFVYANCAALGLYGARSLADLRDKSLVELVHPEEREAVRERIRHLLDGEEIPLREYRLLRMDGREVSIEATSTLIDYQGRPSIQIIARDISGRKRAEREREGMLQQLVAERSRFEAVVRQMPLAVMIAEAPGGRMMFTNPRCEEIFRQELRPAEGFQDYGQWKIFRLDGTPLQVEEFPIVRALRGETVADEELQIERGDGSRGFVSVTATPILEPGGKVVFALAAFSDTTERKAAVKALFDSEERLNLALDAAEMGSCDMLLATGRGVWSRRKFLLFGYPPPQGKSGEASTEMWLERVHPEDREVVTRALEQARREASLFRCEHRIVRADNQEVLWVNVLGRFLCDESGAVCRFIGVVYDVTERRKADEALKRSEEDFRRMADSMPQIVWTANADGSIDYLNAHFEIYTGLDRDSPEVRGNLERPDLLIRLVMHPDDADAVIAAWRLAIESCEPYQAEARIVGVDGGYRWHLCRALPECDERGVIAKWYGTATDINDLREIQEQLRASEARFRWLYESNLIAIFFWNRSGEITEANHAFCDLVGYEDSECRAGQVSWREVTPPEYLARDFSAMEEILERGICRPYEKLFVNRKSGETVSVLIAGARMHGAESEGISFAVDLTDLKRAEEALRTSEATLKIAVDTTGLGIFDCDMASGRKKWSEIMKRHFGLSPDAEVTNETCFEAIHPEDRDRVRQCYQGALRPEGGGLYAAEFRAVGIEDRELRWLTLRGKVFFDQSGVAQRMVGASLDITDIVKAEQALKEEVSERLRAVEELRKQEQLMIRQGRLAAMGEMIGNIAHQWRQPLNTLGLIVQELRVYQQRGLLDADYLNGSVARAMQVINYMSKTIDGFRNFFAPDKEKEAFGAAEVLHRTVSIVEAAFNELKLKIEVSADEEIVVFGCPNEFSQVILNILVNAKDAILERNVPDAKVEVRLFREEGKAVLTIADNAGGIAPEIMDRIFDPYFTTKGPDKGTGIGLFMSKTIIEKNMNGTLTASNKGGGAEFRIEV